jgi:hypothetical protein
MMYDLLNMAVTAQLRRLESLSRRLIAALAICITTAVPLDAAEIKAGNYSGLVVMKGNIETGDYEKLRRFITEGDGTSSLYLASPGGNVAEAMRIGRLVRALRLETQIPGRARDEEIIVPKSIQKEDFMCASACFFIFVAGVHRIIYLDVEDEPLLGVHRPFLTDKDLKALGADEAIQSTNQLRAFIERYLKDMDVPAKYADLLFSVPKDQVRWITGTEFGSDLRGFMPALKDWMDARCDKRTDAEKVMWEAFKDKNPREMTASEKQVSELLEKKQSEKEKCESKALSELQLEAYLKFFQDSR